MHLVVLHKLPGFKAYQTNAAPDIPTKPLGYILHPVTTRDVWMHRIDLWRATEAPLTLTASHDRRIVADLVREWSTTHNDPFAA